MAKKKQQSTLSSALERLQQQFERQRARIVKKAVKPLVSRAKELKRELMAVESEIASYIGDRKKPKARKAAAPTKKTAKRGGKRRRLTSEQKMTVASKAYDLLKKAGEAVSPGNIEKHLDGLKLRELMPLWNKANPSKKIGRKGDKATAKYHA